MDNSIYLIMLLVLVTVLFTYRYAYIRGKRDGVEMVLDQIKDIFERDGQSKVQTRQYVNYAEMSSERHRVPKNISGVNDVINKKP